MKVFVFGVTNWNDHSEAFNQKRDLEQWYLRNNTFLPTNEMFLTAGTYSDPRFNPLPLPLHQIGFSSPETPYSVQNNYWRIGFQTAVWKIFLMNVAFDLAIHVQCTRLIGQDLRPLVEEFMQRDEVVMAPSFKSGCGIDGIDVGFMAMKPVALSLYAVSGHRQSCDPNPKCMNCEEEAYEFYKDQWWNPWPNILTLKQYDRAWEADELNEDKKSPYEITDLDYFCNLPIIAIGKHVSPEYQKAWMKKNPIFPCHLHNTVV
jgi:hypothetical protein